MRIQITHTRLSGNMGDGWRDQREAADAYAAYLHDTLWQYIYACYPQADIAVEVHVEQAEGAGPGPAVASGLATMQHVRLEQDIAALIKAAWDEFGESATATELMG